MKSKLNFIWFLFFSSFLCKTSKGQNFKQYNSSKYHLHILFPEVGYEIVENLADTFSQRWDLKAANSALVLNTDIFRCCDTLPWDGMRECDQRVCIVLYNKFDLKGDYWTIQKHLIDSISSDSLILSQSKEKHYLYFIDSGSCRDSEHKKIKRNIIFFHFFYFNKGRYYEMVCRCGLKFYDKLKTLFFNIADSLAFD